MVAPAIIAAGISAAGMLGSAAISNKGAKKGQGTIDQYLGSIPELGEKYMNPYINRGNQASGIASREYDKLLSDPSGFINAIMGRYNPSTGYQYRANNLNKMMNNTAASGGFAGTPYDQQQRGELINALMGEDMQQWLGNNLNVYGTGLAGKQNEADTGFNASSGLARFIANALGQQGAATYNNQMGNSANKQGLFGGLMGDMAPAIGSMFGGGGGGGMRGGGGAARGGGGYQPLSSIRTPINTNLASGMGNR